MKAAQLLRQIEGRHGELDSHVRESFEVTAKLVDDEERLKALLRGKLRGRALLFQRKADAWEVVVIRNGELVHIPVEWAHEVDVPEPTTGNPDAKPECNVRCECNASVHEYLIGGASVMNLDIHR